jgi:hypothetical protein
MPMSKEVALNPGEVYRGSITVSNPASATVDLNYVIDVMPFNVADESYTIDFVTSSDWSRIVDWITIDEPTGVIEPNDKKEIFYTITVPQDAPSGGQYAMLGVKAVDNSDESDQVSVKNVFEMASIIYARVSGETTHEGDILANSIPGFVTNGEPIVSTTLTNSGNVHEIAQVKISVKNPFTGEVVFPTDDEVNSFSEFVMPSSTRLITRHLNNVPALGVFEVTQDVMYLGVDSELTHNVKTMIMCPLWFLALVIITLGVFIGAILGIIHKHRKNRQVF